MSVPRLIDANANRAREAMRVMEDAARFLLDDAPLAGELKALRHDLASAMGPFVDAVLHRDTPRDVGTTLTTEAEGRRESPHAVAVAAGKRLSEALRAIEEYAKTTPDGAARAAAFERLRYRGYELERRLATRLATGAPRQWRLCVLLSEALCVHRGWLEVARACVEAGADCVQLREKALPADELRRRTATLIELARPRGVSVIVNDRPDVAFTAGADGVHLGQHDLPCRDARRLVGRALRLGVSTTNLAQAHQAVHDGADYCGVGPMFASTTAPEKSEIAGPQYLRQYLAAVALPHLAIGGVTPDNIGQLVAAGAEGVAVSAAVCGASDPGGVVQRLLASWPGDSG